MRSQAKAGHKDFTIQDELLLCRGALVVPDTKLDDTPVRTALIKEVYNQPSLAHPGRGKTLKLLRQRFWWKGYAEHVA